MVGYHRLVEMTLNEPFSASVEFLHRVVHLPKSPLEGNSFHFFNSLNESNFDIALEEPARAVKRAAPNPPEPQPLGELELALSRGRRVAPVTVAAAAAESQCFVTAAGATQHAHMHSQHAPCTRTHKSQANAPARTYSAQQTPTAA